MKIYLFCKVVKVVMPGTPLGTVDKLRPMLLIASIFFGLFIGALFPGYSGLFNAIIFTWR